jgi:hypothetical protein
VRAKTYFTRSKSNRVASACKLCPSDCNAARRPPGRPAQASTGRLSSRCSSTSLRAPVLIDGTTFAVCGDQGKRGSSRGRTKQSGGDATQLGTVQLKRTFELQGHPPRGEPEDQLRSVSSRCDRSESASNLIRGVYAVSNKERPSSPAKGEPLSEESDRERLRILCTIVRRGRPGWSPVSESKERSEGLPLGLPRITPESSVASDNWQPHSRPATAPSCRALHRNRLVIRILNIITRPTAERRREDLTADRVFSDYPQIRTVLKPSTKGARTDGDALFAQAFSFIGYI